jgi:Uma2 family endonuclease
MSQVPTKSARVKETLEPAWEVAYLFPPQGQWTHDDYLALDTNRLIELSEGRLEVLPMPTPAHQRLLLYLYGLLLSFTTDKDLGEVLVAGLPVRLGPGKYREPDVVFMLKEHAKRIGAKYWKGADLAMEVVSGGKEDRHRDLVIKRQEYAKGGIPEYWIVDPKHERITVLRLDGDQYAVHGEFGKGTVATSALLAGFTVDVTAAFASQLGRAGKKKSSAKDSRRGKGR